ncbi:hypothetical protein ACOMHN_011833 [Nucella lapillus]
MITVDGLAKRPCFRHSNESRRKNRNRKLGVKGRNEDLVAEPDNRQGRQAPPQRQPRSASSLTKPGLFPLSASLARGRPFISFRAGASGNVPSAGGGGVVPKLGRDDPGKDKKAMSF